MIDIQSLANGQAKGLNHHNRRAAPSENVSSFASPCQGDPKCLHPRKQGRKLMQVNAAYGSLMQAIFRNYFFRQKRHIRRVALREKWPWRSHHSKPFKGIQSYSKGFRKKIMCHETFTYTVQETFLASIVYRKSKMAGRKAERAGASESKQVRAGIKPIEIEIP
jgi:hypothetical protein